MKNFAMLFSLIALTLVALPVAADDAVTAAPVAGAELELNSLFDLTEELEVQNRACTKKGKPGDCVCPQVYDPVCGCNGQTYSNSCFASCEVQYWTAGECGSTI